MTEALRRARTSAARAEAPADVLAHGWIAAVRRADPATGERGGLQSAEDWIVETVLKLGFAAPDRAYEVGVRIVELSDDPRIIEAAAVAVFDDLLRRDRPRFLARLSSDARRLPGLRLALDHVSPDGLDPFAKTRRL